MGHELQDTDDSYPRVSQDESKNGVIQLNGKKYRALTGESSLVSHVSSELDAFQTFESTNWVPSYERRSNSQRFFNIVQETHSHELKT